MKNKEELLRALDYIKENECSQQLFYNCDTCPHDKFDDENGMFSVCPYKRNYNYIKEFIEEQTKNERIN